MADLISLTFLHLLQLWVLNPQNLQMWDTHVKHRTKSEHHIFFTFLLQSYQTPSPASLFATVKQVLQTEWSANTTSQKKKSLSQWRQSHWQVRFARLFSDDCDQSKSYFQLFAEVFLQSLLHIFSIRQQQGESISVLQPSITNYLWQKISNTELRLIRI